MEENFIILRIKELMKHFNVSPAQFADKIKMDRSGFSKRMNGHVAIGDAVVNKIVLALNVNKDWLLTGEGDMLKNADLSPPGDCPDCTLMRRDIELLEKAVTDLKKENKELIEQNAVLNYRLNLKS